MDGIVDDLVDGGGGFGEGWFAEVKAGDLEAVEEETGAAGIEFVGGEAAEDETGGDLDGGAILGTRDGKARLAATAGGCILNRAAGGVVVVAELLAAQGGTATAVAVVEDVAAFEAGGFIGVGG